ncbi:hypothetical protein LuPra_04249 [Luteitalea pratensis]|uniref:Uncharacterized protein n=1 Tax=Luteitalea pratensis TaxID=1855912 RepID=A0A143PQX7_LUTPR|nr:hypothetical protein [Luteitalea pratensis]AMY11005.1 hypothetical protein LuPra_04249 [Luteitalea pratensis]
MTDHDDTQLDAALEALARQDIPPDHVARVLARTSAEQANAPVDARGGQVLVYLRPRWLFPIAATVLAVLGATWQLNRQVETWLPAETAGSESRPYQLHVWGAPEEIVQPVLPPQAYWGMDPFREFATLRSGTQEHRNTGTQGGRQASAGTARNGAAWVPPPSDLPPIDLESIVAASLDVAPAEPLEVITLADIPLATIVIGPITEEEDP